MTDQETPDGTQEHPEGGSATPSSPEGKNGPQTGAQSLQGERRPRGPVDWARQQAADRQDDAAKTRQETETLKTTLARVRTIAADLFVTGRTESERAAGRRLLNALTEPAHNAGPSVAECAAHDRRWPLEKAGE